MIELGTSAGSRDRGLTTDVVRSRNSAAVIVASVAAPPSNPRSARGDPSWQVASVVWKRRSVLNQSRRICGTGKLCWWKKSNRAPERPQRTRM